MEVPKDQESQFSATKHDVPTNKWCAEEHNLICIKTGELKLHRRVKETGNSSFKKVIAENDTSRLFLRLTSTSTTSFG